jgi:hypothetical protein
MFVRGDVYFGCAMPCASMKYRTTWVRTSLRLSAALVSAAWLAAQTAAVFRASVALVHVDAEVTVNGRTLTGLTMDDFRVFDEGRLQTVMHFANEQQPLYSNARVRSRTGYVVPKP